MILNKRSDAIDARYPEGTIKYAALHCHTENSLQDGVQKVKEMVAKCESYGAQKVCITDHGRMMGFDELTEAVAGKNIKPIYGIEAYLLDPLTQRRAHLCLYAKDLVGYQQLTMTMARGTFNDDGEATIDDANLEMLKGGHIIATSACIDGVLGSIKMFNIRLDKKVAEWTARQSELSVDMDAYNEAKKTQTNLDSQLALTKKELTETKKKAKATFTQKEKSLARRQEKFNIASEAFDAYMMEESDKAEKAFVKALQYFELYPESPDEYEEALTEAKNSVIQQQARLESEKQTTQRMADNIPVLEAKINDMKNELADVKQEVVRLAKINDKYNQIQKKIDDFNAQKLSHEQARSHFAQRLKLMYEVFPNNFYIEVQNHGMEEEKIIYPWLCDVAKHYNLPLVAANDAHVTNNSEKDFKLRQIRRSCRFNKWEDQHDSDKELYIKTDRELANALLQILPEDAVIQAMDNVQKIVEQCDVTLKKVSHAPKADVENVTEKVMEMARANIQAKYGESWSTQHEERLNYEMSVIAKMGFSDYFFITQNIVEAGRKIGALSYEKLDELKGIMDTMTLEDLMAYLEKYGTEVNLSVGLGRGSGAGSIVCYLLGITNIDPFKYDLLFERFLNPERISMPDIDSDFRSDIKDVLLVYLKLKYGNRAVAQILTKSYLQGRSAMLTASRIMSSRDTIARKKAFDAGEQMKENELTVDAKGNSVIVPVNYDHVVNRMKLASGVDLDAKSLEDNKPDMLNEAQNDIEVELVENAVLLDNNLDHTGLHAAGCIISDNHDLSEYIPVAWDNGAKTWKTQCNMTQCEDLHGLLKMDVRHVC